MKIDFVIPWVDGDDDEWKKVKEKYLINENNQNNKDNRYRDMGCLKYFFRSIEKYASWVNNIFFITWGHVPQWLNINNNKLKIINHKDYIPKEYLPTFSSHVIELNLHRIESLSPYFVYFNDDVFITNYMQKKDFFENNLPKEYAIMSPIIPTSDFEHIVLNNIKIINKNFDKNVSFYKNFFKWINLKYGKDNIRTLFLNSWDNICGFKESHLANSFLKETFKDVWDKEYSILNETCKNKYRTNNDVNQWLIKYWQIMQGKFIPQNPNIGKRFDLSNDNSKIIKSIKNKKYKIICINDANMNYDFEKAKKELIETFQNVLPQKSSFEK